jgi:hypothetical protein
VRKKRERRSDFAGKQEEFMGLWAGAGPGLIDARRVSGRHHRTQLVLFIRGPQAAGAWTAWW